MVRLFTGACRFMQDEDDGLAEDALDLEELVRASSSTTINARPMVGSV